MYIKQSVGGIKDKQSWDLNKKKFIADYNSQLT